MRVFLCNVSSSLVWPILASSMEIIEMDTTLQFTLRTVFDRKIETMATEPIKIGQTTDVTCFYKR